MSVDGWAQSQIAAQTDAILHPSGGVKDRLNLGSPVASADQCVMQVVNEPIGLQSVITDRFAALIGKSRDDALRAGV